MDIGRLKWQCRRGCKELDVLLSRYLENTYPLASNNEQYLFANLLKLEDDDLLALVLGQSPDAPAPVLKLIDQINHPS